MFYSSGYYGHSKYMKYLLKKLFVVQYFFQINRGLI